MSIENICGTLKLKRAEKEEAEAQDREHLEQVMAEFSKRKLAELNDHYADMRDEKRMEKENTDARLLEEELEELNDNWTAVNTGCYVDKDDEYLKY